MGTCSINIQVPSWNTCYKISRNRIYKTSEAAAFQAAVGLSYKGDLHKGDVEVFIEFWRSPPIDVDNACKLCADSLEGRAYLNDRQIIRLTVDRYPCNKGEDYLFISVNPVP